MSLTTSVLYALTLPGIIEVDYFGEKAYTNEKSKVFLIAKVIDMGGVSPGLGEDLPITTVRQNIGTKINNKAPDMITKTPLKSIYALYYGKRVLYVDGSGRFIFRNARLVSAEGEDLTLLAEARAARIQAGKNLKALTQIAESEMLVYPAFQGSKAERAVMTVFTDVDCPFCRRIHQELEAYTNSGITIKYIFYPRAGRQSKAYQTFVNVWCSQDSYAAFEKAEAGQAIATGSCSHPVEKHLELAESFNLIGTPAIFLPDGTLIVGYRSPAELIKLVLTHLK